MNSFDYLECAVTIAKEAGKKLIAEQTVGVEILSNTGKDIKLKADQLSEEIIVNFLSEKTSLPILGEESGLHGDSLTDTAYWVIDPLDGTLNYLRGVPFYCISIGLWHGQEPVLGVIYDLSRQKMYTGIVGEGAWLDGERIRVADTISQRQAVLATGFPTYRDYENVQLQRFIEDIQSFKKVRLFGAAALSLALLSAGVVDAYAEEDIMFWDVAAGIALVKAAGGTVRYEASSRIKWGMSVFCACDPNLLPET